MLARGKKVIGIRGEVFRKFGQFNSPGVVFFIKDGRVWRGNDRNCVDKELDKLLFAVNRTAVIH